MLVLTGPFSYSSIQRGLAAVSTETSKVGMRPSPTEVTLLVRDLEGPLRLPTHALAIQGKSGQELELFPIHDVLFASHCAYLPYFHAPKVPLEVATHGNGAMTLTVPVVKYELPDPRSFSFIYNYLYRHDVNAFLAALLPLPPTAIQYIVATTSMMATSGRAPPPFNNLDVDEDADSESEHDSESDADEEMFEGATSSSRTTSPSTSPTSDPAPTPKRATATESTPAAAPAAAQQTPEQKRQQEDLIKLAGVLARTFALPRLLQQARFIHGVWSNVIMLGIADVGVWNAMDYAWSVTMKALVFATETMRRQQQQQAP